MRSGNLIMTVVVAVTFSPYLGCTTIKELRSENETLRSEVNRLESLVNDYSKEINDVKNLSEKEKADLRREMQQMRENLRKNLDEQIQQNEALVEKVDNLTVVEVGEAALFGSGLADLTQKGTKVIKRLVSTLNQYPGYHIRVEGHTDSIPIGENLKPKFLSNWELSTARATTVVRYMIYGLQMKPNRLSAVGYAQYRPAASNTTPEGRAKNRRIRMVVFKEMAD